MKRPVLVAGLSLLVLVLASPAQASYPPVGVTCAVGSSPIEPGQLISVFGSNWLAGTTVNITVHSRTYHVGSAHVGRHGSFNTKVAVPATLHKGRHSVIISGTNASGQATTQSCSLLVAIPPAPAALPLAGGGEIAYTGANFLLGIGILLGLTVIGFLALALGRRKAGHGAGS